MIQSADANQSLSDTLATGDGTDTVSGFESASLSGGGLGEHQTDASAVTGTNVTLAGGGRQRHPSAAASSTCSTVRAGPTRCG